MNLLLDVLEARPSSSVLVADGAGRTATVGDLLAARAHVDAALSRLGVPPGVPIALAAPAGFMSAVVLLALLGRGPCLPISPRAGEPEIQFAMTDARVAALVAAEAPVAASVAASAGVPVVGIELPPQGPLIEVVGGTGHERRRNDVPSDAAALYLHTSGTTARPKLVALRSEQLLHVARSVAAVLGLTPDDRGLTVMPLFHIHGIVAGLLAPVLSGGTVVVRSFDAFAHERLLTESGCTWSTAVPSMYQAVLARPPRAPARSTSLRLLRSSSAPLPDRVATELEARFGCPVVNSYGMTEAAHQMASQAPDGERRAGTVGRAIGCELAALVEGSVTDAVGASGELVVRGPGVIDAYAAGAAASEHHVEVPTGPCAGRWFRTGDLGTIERGGHVRLRGRLKEIINVAGEKVSPYEVEAVVGELASVWTCVAFPLPDGLRGERVAVLVVPRGADGPIDVATDVTVDLERLVRDHVRDRLAAHKVPARVVVAASLPLGPTGKLQRNRLAGVLGLDPG